MFSLAILNVIFTGILLALMFKVENRKEPLLYVVLVCGIASIIFDCFIGSFK